MNRRVVEISRVAHLALKNCQLVIKFDDDESARVPIEDLGVLILDNVRITHSQAVLSNCFNNDVTIVMCNEKHIPDAIMLPISGHSLQTKILKQQVAASIPTKKRLWQKIVREKISSQYRALYEATGKHYKDLLSLSMKVKSGDSENIEAHAARIYWQRMFGNNFIRDRYISGVNSMLNYGYAIIRAVVARTIVGAGLHPSFGVHHTNQYNAFCLADDIMEPFRPLVDAKVYRIHARSNNHITEILDQADKREILSILSYDFTVNNFKGPLFPALNHYVASIRRVLCGESNSVLFPILEKPEICSKSVYDGAGCPD